MMRAQQHKMEKAEKIVTIYKEETIQAKKQANMLKMELDKQVNALQLKQRVIDDSNRINSLRESQFQLKESELRETSAKLTVYQQIDSTMRMRSAVDDIEPELRGTRDLKKQVEELERTVAILKEENASELSIQVLEL